MSYFYIETKIDNDVYKEAMSRYSRMLNITIPDSEAFSDVAFVKCYYDVLLKKHNKEYKTRKKQLLDNWEGGPGCH